MKRYKPEQGKFFTTNNSLAGYLLLKKVKLISYSENIYTFDDKENICKHYKKEFEQII